LTSTTIIAGPAVRITSNRLGTSSNVEITANAGNALAEYPFFEYVAAFNEDTSVSAAIDPTRYPAIVGHTGDIYVVAAKTAAEWDADPALLDVTPDGALTVTFTGDTIQQNTFVLTQPFDLDAGAGYELGLGYDVVIDLNQNGVLDAGDYIDGRSDEAGLYAVIDTPQPGPYAVTELPSYSVGPVFGIPSSMTFQNTFYPSNIAALGELPLIVISHGSGHQYTWYDHIGTHLASHGYVVMSHQNNNGPGIEYCSVTTLGHTEAFLNQLGTIGGGALQGHVDASRILWLGHQRGAEGVARAYDRLHDHEYTHGAVPPTNYSIDDIRLLILMAPTDFMGPAKSNPHGAPAAVWVGSGDSDITGAPGCDICQSLRFYDRATGFRHAFILQGTKRT
jgi:hypothetical protein